MEHRPLTRLGALAAMVAVALLGVSGLGDTVFAVISRRQRALTAGAVIVLVAGARIAARRRQRSMSTTIVQAGRS